MDKLIERARYDARAEQQIAREAKVEVCLGSETMRAYLRTPYLTYEQKIAESIKHGHRVLELAAGSGLHTVALLQTGAKVIASDISPASLRLLKHRFEHTLGNLDTVVADMEDLPFEASSFDVVACAGGLSYGEPHIVDAEIRRVLRPGGILICVDSLNHNPIYRINRWVHYLRGNRSKSTLKRMPNLTRIRALGGAFSNVDVRFFGALSFAMPAVAHLMGDDAAEVISDRVDQWFGSKRSAFKFVLVAEGLS
jgi:ubiquinone/menaquinone biosynthesis C-methylase UbiE